MRGTEQVPPVPGHVEEHGDGAIGLVARSIDELHPVVHHVPILRGEIVDPQEEAHPTCRLLTHGRCLPFTVGAGEQHPGGGTGRAYHHPPLLPTVAGERQRVVDEFEAELVDEERNGRVVVVDNDGNRLDVHVRTTPPSTGLTFPACHFEVGRFVRQ